MKRISQQQKNQRRATVSNQYHELVAPGLLDERGAGLAEYALLLLLIAIPVAVVVPAFAGSIVNALNQASGMF